MKNFFGIGGRLRDAYTERHEPESMRILANLYWRTLLFMAACIAALAVLYGVPHLISILGVSQEASSSSRAAAGGPSLDRAELEMLVKGFTERRDMYESLKNTTPQIADPSR